MCRIAGIASKAIVPEDSVQLKSMLNVLRAGGPDDEGTFVNEHVALGHRRLSIIDLSSAGHQPMIHPEGIVISYNGEVYNYREIRTELEAEGVIFRSSTDTEVIISAFLKWGVASFRKLKGMFALALYNAHQKKLYLVRDPAGIKPLYYSVRNGRLVFASEVRAFKSMREHWPEDHRWRSLFLAFGFLPHPFTTLKDVNCLSPGVFLDVDLDSMNSKEVRFETIFDSKDVVDVDENSVIDHVRQQTRKALERHLISDAPLGVFLSGGIDSSLLTLLASEANPDTLRTVSVNFKETSFDESRYQQMILEKVKREQHQSYLVEEGMLWDSLDDIWHSMDQPSIDGVNSYFVSRCAHESGLKAVLSGLGADEIFGGYASVGRADWIPSLRALPLKKILSKPAGAWRDAYGRISFLTLPGPVGDYLFLRGINTPEVIAEVLQIDETKVWETLANVEVSLPKNLNKQQYASFLEFYFYMSGQLLKDTDYMSMHFGLEVRVPFLDIDLISTVRSVCPSILFNKSQPKYALTKAFEDILPTEIINRKKQGFTFPFHLWLKNRMLKDKGLISESLWAPLQVDRFISGGVHWSRCWSGVVLNGFKS
jgi:asparagine synthase (glutamine-hydrolysing)